MAYLLADTLVFFCALGVGHPTVVAILERLSDVSLTSIVGKSQIEVRWALPVAFFTLALRGVAIPLLAAHVSGHVTVTVPLPLRNPLVPTGLIIIISPRPDIEGGRNRELRRAGGNEEAWRGRRGLPSAAECVAGYRRARARAAETKNQLGFISPLVRSARARGVRNSSVALA